MSRSYLFLQGPIGPFFNILAQKLASSDNKVFRINFNSADKFSWRKLPSTDFTENLAELPEFINRVITEEAITDIIMFGDSRPVHDIAIKTIAEQNVKIHVFEEGYFRPNWITYEQGGVNRNSSLPGNKEFYANWRSFKLPEDEKFGGSFFDMAWFSFTYYLTGIPGMYFSFRKYKHHFGISPHKTIALWALKLVTNPWRKLVAHFQQKQILKLNYFIVPLQLCRDYQIKLHSQFKNMPNFIDHVISDFALNAKQQDCLLFKIHPLENNSARLKKAIADSAMKHQLMPRVKIIDGGHLPTLTQKSKGMVVANSTSGLSAIHHKKPVIALSPAIYNFEGLTNQKGLAQFWQSPERPEMNLYNKFRNYVIRKTQINGNFYNRRGMKAALNGAYNRLLAREAAAVTPIASKRRNEAELVPEAVKLKIPG